MKALGGRVGGPLPSVAVALGSGGARGISHVVALEALDELGIRPVAIAGTSMGAVIGAAYASGLDAHRIRTHVLRVLRNRSNVLGKLLRARVGRFADLILRGRGNPVLLDPEVVLELFWPTGVPEDFGGLATQMIVVATNFSERSELAFQSGSLSAAVAGSMAIPGLFRPVEHRGCLLIDGGAVNPLPYDHLFDLADIVIAVDVTFGGRSRVRRAPTPLEAMFGAAQIMQGVIISQKIKRRPPDILIRPRVEQFGLLDFFRAGQILRAAETSKEEMRDAITSQLTSIVGKHLRSEQIPGP